MLTKNYLHLLYACRDRSEVLNSFIFQGYDNLATQGLDMGAPQDAYLLGGLQAGIR